jgi:arsenite oxidase small subunit
LAATNQDSSSKENPDQSPTPRRNFLRTALAFSIVLLVGGIATVLKAISGQPPTQYSSSSTQTSRQGFPKLKVANVNELQINEPVFFNYPLDSEPNVLVKLGVKADGAVGPDGDIVAYSQICQHLGCIYAFQKPGSSPSCNSSFNAPKPVGYCCCHGTIYDLVNAGKVVSGPSPRPVPQVDLQFDSATGDIYAIGMMPPTIFGHCTGSDDVSCDLQGGTPVA